MTITMLKNNFRFHQKLMKEDQNQNPIAKRLHLRRKKIAEIEEEEKNINNELFKKYFTNYRSPSDMYKK